MENKTYIRIELVRSLETKGYPATAAFLRAKVSQDDPYVDVDLIETMMHYELRDNLINDLKGD